MSGVISAVAKQLKVNPDYVYAELVINDQARVFPFDVVFDSQFDSVFKTKDIYEHRCSPLEYNK
jgi:hypothetical protein